MSTINETIDGNAPSIAPAVRTPAKNLLARYSVTKAAEELKGSPKKQISLLKRLPGFKKLPGARPMRKVAFGPRIAAGWQALVEHLNNQTELQTEEEGSPE